MIAAIVAAAGIGTRMKNDTPKPYLALAGKPILAHTLAVFEKIKDIREVTLVVHPDELSYCQERVISPYGLKKVLRLVPGGKERQDSVYNALKALKHEDELEIVLVHDGVRPFFTPDQVCRLIAAARSFGAAVLGLPAQDTLKTVNTDGVIQKTLERKDVWQIQTPQAFQAPLLRRAFVQAYSRNFYGTDEASLVEALKQPVVVVPGSPLNLKITTPDDLALAEAILPMMRKKNRASRTGV